MRKRFEPQLQLGQLPIDEVYISPKSKNSIDELIAALHKLYCTKSYINEIFDILDKAINKGKSYSGRPGMSLWEIFVLAQLRLCRNLSYDDLHNLANNHKTLRQIMGVEYEFGYERITYEYQNIYDNVTLLSDAMVKDINAVIVAFGHSEVFKKKDVTALRLKSDSFVVESNVHFPTDYNLLWDCVRKCLDGIGQFLDKYPHIKGWRKLSDWKRELKGLMRELGKASGSGGKNKQERVEKAAENYLKKAGVLIEKLQVALPTFPQNEMSDILLIINIEHFMLLLEEHIGLVHRRIIKGEKIAHDEKLFSVFETYTEWINKGKPFVELGKKVCITTDQYHLIVDSQVMPHQQDREIVIALADRLLSKYNIASWSFDKGFWSKDNKALLQLEIPQVIMPKLGKRNKAEEAEEKAPPFKQLKNKHSAVESNINELEHRGLDRCPDRGEAHFKRYISLGVCAYNLKKIGREILRQQQKEIAYCKIAS